MGENPPAIFLEHAMSHPTQPEKPRRTSGHVLPRRPEISLHEPGRLRTAHVLALTGLSHSTLYSRKLKGTFPAPDGRDGGLNYWRTETILKYLSE